MQEENKVLVEENEPHLEENSTIFAFQEEVAPSKVRKRIFGGYGKLIAILFCICAIVGIGITCTLLFGEVPTEDATQTEQSQSIKIINENTSADKITVKNQSAEYTLIKYEEKSDDTTTVKYKLEGFDNYSIDNDLVTVVADTLLPLNAETKLEGTWSDSQLGLDKPQITVNIGDLTLSVGKSTSMQDRYYARVSGDDNVYLISSEVYDAINQQPCDFASTEMIEALTEDNYEDYFSNGILVSFDDITINGNAYNEKIVVDCLHDEGDISSYAVTTPKRFYADMSMVELLLTPFSNGLTSTGAYALIDDNTNLSTYGLGKPEYIYTYKFGDVTYKIELSKQGIIDDSVYACRINSGNIIYKCNTDSISFLVDNLNSLRSTVLFSTSITKVDTFTVSYNNSSISYDIGLEKVTENGSTNEKTVVKSMDGKELDTESFQNIYMALASVSPSDYTNDTASIKSQPYLYIKLDLTDNTTSEVKFLKYNDRYYLMTVDGIGDQLISYKVVDRLIGYFDDFKAGKTIDTPAIYD